MIEEEDDLKKLPWKLVTSGFKGGKISYKQNIRIRHAPSKELENLVSFHLHLNNYGAL